MVVFEFGSETYSSTEAEWKLDHPITFTPSEQSFERVLLEGLRMYLLDLKH
jgi:hypothetical protein